MQMRAKELKVVSDARALLIGYRSACMPEQTMEQQPRARTHTRARGCSQTQLTVNADWTRTQRAGPAVIRSHGFRCNTRTRDTIKTPQSCWTHSSGPLPPFSDPQPRPCLQDSERLTSLSPARVVFQHFKSGRILLCVLPCAAGKTLQPRSAQRTKHFHSESP